LHLFFELDLPLPEQDLAFGFYDLGEDICLLLLEVGDVVFKLDALILELLEFLLELVFNIEVIVP